MPSQKRIHRALYAFSLKTHYRPSKNALPIQQKAKGSRSSCAPQLPDKVLHFVFVMVSDKLHKLLNPARWSWVLVHLFCICIFLVQLFQLLPSYFAPTMTHTEVRELQMKDLDFPLDIKVCVKPDFNETALEELGYGDASDYILGRSKFNPSMVGWGGHSGKSLTKTNAKEVLDAARIDLMKDIFYKVSFTTIAGKRTGNLVDKFSLERINQVSNCHILNFTKVNKQEKKGIKWIQIRLSKEVMEKNNLTVELKLQGQSLATSRDIVEHGFFSSGGPPMKLDHQDPKFLKYIVRLKKDVFVEEDPSKGCRNYPNSDFPSYKECDSKYLKNRIKDLGRDKHLMPPWIAKDLTEVSEQPMLVSNELLGSHITQSADQDPRGR